jgi:hypothetical protein
VKGVDLSMNEIGETFFGMGYADDRMQIGSTEIHIHKQRLMTILRKHDA